MIPMVSRPTCWAHARERFVRFGAALAERESRLHSPDLPLRHSDGAPRCSAWQYTAVRACACRRPAAEHSIQSDPLTPVSEYLKRFLCGFLRGVLQKLSANTAIRGFGDIIWTCLDVHGCLDV